jgi:hypothetical protein
MKTGELKEKSGVGVKTGRHKTEYRKQSNKSLFLLSSDFMFSILTPDFKYKIKEQ